MRMTSYEGSVPSRSIRKLYWGHFSSAGHFLQGYTFPVEQAPSLGAPTDQPLVPQFSLHKDLLMGCGSIRGSVVIGVEGCANRF